MYPSTQNHPSLGRGIICTPSTQNHPSLGRGIICTPSTQNHPSLGRGIICTPSTQNHPSLGRGIICTPPYKFPKYYTLQTIPQSSSLCRPPLLRWSPVPPGVPHPPHDPLRTLPRPHPGLLQQAAEFHRQRVPAVSAGQLRLRKRLGGASG